MSNNGYQYLINRNSKNDKFAVWKFDPDNPKLVSKIKTASSNAIEKSHHLTQVGNYLLEWSPLSKDGHYTYRLLEFDPSQPNPLGSVKKGEWTENALQAGSWKKSKFFGSRSDFANQKGATKGYESGTDVVLCSLGNFVLNWIPTPGRGTYHLFNFDHGSHDPLPAAVTPQGAWQNIQEGHTLVPIGGYVIDWEPRTSDYSVWQFDAQSKDPLPFPAIQQGNWKSLGLDKKHELIAIGNYILDWVPANGSYRLWKFDHKSKNPLNGPIKSGKLPASFGKDSTITAVETIIPVDQKKARVAGSIDFMRSKIEHVVYYMIENRSLDHVCGWLYEKNVPNTIIGPQGPYDGLKNSKFVNRYQGKDYRMTKYENGKLPKKNGKPFCLNLDHNDPYHDNSDVLRQLFFENKDGYATKSTPDMGGFAWNNGTAEVMLSYSPTQLPVLNGLAEKFAISDKWFCSMPGGTDVNRAFSLTGSSFGELNNFQNGVEYQEWSDFPHRPSIWKVLWSNGISDWKIYNAVEWVDCKFTYNLFLKGQIPTVDSPYQVGNYAPQLNQFYDDAKYDTLPAFSFLEPKWVASNGSTSYHPGNDLIPGERTLNDIFNALQNSPAWEKTLLVITFDEHGGIADHVPPPYAEKPYANESVNGFDFDLLGVRVPTILVSPWINEKTVFRSETDVDYDSTSILATLLDWFGIPRSKWGLGERTNHAPTFEGVLRAKTARTKKIELTPPSDSKFPKDGKGQDCTDVKLNDLHQLVTPRMVSDITKGKVSGAEALKIAESILAASPNESALHKNLDELHKKYKGL